eukprot:scaffold7671_cov417-Prasinococcus_capsulatus_cf.AAC.5
MPITLECCRRWREHSQECPGHHHNMGTLRICHQQRGRHSVWSQKWGIGWYASPSSVSDSSCNERMTLSGCRVEVTVFQSFFVSLRLPFSIVRGEVTHVPVAVYNYANTSIEGVQVSIDVSSEHFTIVGGETGTNSLGGRPQLGIRIRRFADFERTHVAVISTSIGAQSSSSVTFVLEAIALGNLPIRINAVTPTSVGLSDAVARHLLVKPEGFEQEHVLNSVIELSEGVEQTIKLDATLPDDIVDGASRGYLRVVGDLMSQSIEGLEQLVQQPYGCGEQNMITTAPNLYVAQYLWATGKLTPELKKRTVTYMIQGYGRELKYMLGDGGFSAFENDQVSSTWLTAFVLKVFSQAAASPQNFIVVDEDLLAQSVDFLLGRRLASGEYEEDGVVIHTEMIGGVQSEVALTAYVGKFLDHRSPWRYCISASADLR